MNDERTELQRRLLNDVLRDDLAVDGNDPTREAAFGAFRRTRLLRRVRRASVIVTVVAAIAAGILIQRDLSTNRHLTAGNRTPLVVLPAEKETNARDLRRLTDEALIASFPPNSCFLAEVDGRQVLVFTDPALEEKVRGFGRPSRNTGL
jgi:hypothetical protein